MKPTRKELEGYLGLKTKCARLYNNWEKLKSKCYKHDWVTASSRTLPFAKQSVHVHGYDKNGRRQVDSAKQAYLGALAQVQEIECKIEGIEDMLVGEAVRLFYVEGKTWEQAAGVLQYSGTSDALRMRVTRYLA